MMLRIVFFLFPIVFIACENSDANYSKLNNIAFEIKQNSALKKENREQIFREMYTGLSFFVKMYSSIESNCTSLKHPLYLMHKDDGEVSNIGLQKKDGKTFVSIKQNCFELTKYQVAIFDSLVNRIPQKESHLLNSDESPVGFTSVYLIFWDGKKVHYYNSPSHSKKKEIEDLKYFLLSLEQNKKH